ncbi:MAG: terminase gpA endonuclease subunit [Planctomycetaceae bacterium]
MIDSVPDPTPSAKLSPTAMSACDAARLMSRLRNDRVGKGDRGCLSPFGNRPEQHRLFAHRLAAEYRVKTEGRGRTVDEWKLRPERGDNHWFDCLVGCAVAASIQGVSLMDQTPKPKPRARRRRVDYLFQ